MAKVVYRGVAYDTDQQVKKVAKKVTQTYRGIKHVETINVEAAK